MTTTQVARKEPTARTRPRRGFDLGRGFRYRRVAELPAIDMLGLNDLHIGHRQMPDMGSGPVGHEKYDVDYVLQRAPSYILVGVYGLSPDPLPANRMITPYYAAERLLLQHPQFLAHYRAAVASVPGGRFVYFVRVVP